MPSLIFYSITHSGHSSPRPEMSVRSIPSPSETLNLTVLVRPENRTVLVEPSSLAQCQSNITTNLVIAIFSAPGNSVARSLVRWDNDDIQLKSYMICMSSKTWTVEMRKYPGVEIVFFLGRDKDQDTHVSLGSGMESKFTLTPII